MKSINNSQEINIQELLEERLEGEIEERLEFASWTSCSCNHDN